MWGNAVIMAGWGYWDTTRYPYGGDFRRAEVDTPIQTVEKLARGEWRVRFADGGTAVVKQQGIRMNEEGA